MQNYRFSCCLLSLAIMAFLPHAGADSSVDLTAAAERGDPLSQLTLGRAYLKGIGVPLDAAKAREWIRNAAEQGNAEAEFSLAVLFLTGKGVDKDLKEAFAWFRKAADQRLAKAQFNVGLMFIKGEGVERNEQEGFAWISLAAGQDFPEAVEKVGSALYFGDLGQKRDYRKAFPILEKAAQMGRADAQNLVGLMLNLGHGVDLNAEGAKVWFRRAAEQGHGKAQANLAQAFLFQSKDTDSRIEGLKWLLIAKKGGEVTAVNTLNEVLPKISKKDLSEAERLASEFQVSKP